MNRPYYCFQVVRDGNGKTKAIVNDKQLEAYKNEQRHDHRIWSAHIAKEWTRLHRVKVYTTRHANNKTNNALSQRNKTLEKYAGKTTE